MVVGPWGPAWTLHYELLECVFDEPLPTANVWFVSNSGNYRGTTVTYGIQVLDTAVCPGPYKRSVVLQSGTDAITSPVQTLTARVSDSSPGTRTKPVIYVASPRRSRSLAASSSVPPPTGNASPSPSLRRSLSASSSVPPPTGSSSPIASLRQSSSASSPVTPTQSASPVQTLTARVSDGSGGTRTKPVIIVASARKSRSTPASLAASPTATKIGGKAPDNGDGDNVAPPAPDASNEAQRKLILGLGVGLGAALFVGLIIAVVVIRKKKKQQIADQPPLSGTQLASTTEAPVGGYTGR